MEAENSALCFARVVFIRPSRKQNKTKKKHPLHIYILILECGVDRRGQGDRLTMDSFVNCDIVLVDKWRFGRGWYQEVL